MNKPLLLLFFGLLILPNAISASCGLANDDQLIFRISGTTNAHAELYDGTSYATEICYNTIFGSGYTGASPHSGNTVLKASAATNAHVEQSDQLNYSTNINYGNLVCTYGASCGAGETCVATISSATNAHVATCTDPAAYVIKVCCKPVLVPIPQCNILSVSPSPVSQGSSATVTVSYSDFTPAASGHLIICDDGASPSAVSCNLGACTFTCGLYSSTGPYIISVQLASIAGGTIDCGFANIQVNPVPGSLVPAFQITFFELDPSVATLDESNPEQIITANIKVANAGDGAVARITLELFDEYNNKLELDEMSASRNIAASAEEPFLFTFTADRDWPAGNYFAYAKAFDTESPSNLHDSAMRVLTVNLKRSIPVPELGLVFVPLLAVSALAIMFFAGRSGKAKK